MAKRVELPNGEVVYYRDSDHSYWLGYDEHTGKCSQRLAGVSTVAKALDTNADPLITWGAKLEAQGICELLESVPPEDVTDFIARGGENLHRDLVSAGLDWRAVRNRRASEGTTIHEDVFAALARGKRPSLADVPDAIRGYGQAAFGAWLKLNPKPIAVEQVIYLPDERVAGRFDLLAEIDGVVTLIDAKTSKRAYLSHHVQLAGYVEGCEASGFPRPERSLICLLFDNGHHELVPGAATPEDWGAACEAYRATKRISKAEREQVKAQPPPIAA